MVHVGMSGVVNVVRDAVRRKRKYVIGVDGEAIGRKISRHKDSMVEQETEYFGQIVNVEEKAKLVCEAAGVASFEISQYLIVARQCYSLAKRFTQSTRDLEAKRLVDFWGARGLDPDLLESVCEAGGCRPGEAAGVSLEDVLEDIGAIEHHWHSRWRVYPQDVTATVTVASVAAANVFGAWTLAIPVNTVPFNFDVIGLVVEQVDAATTYHFQLGYNPVNVVPGVNMELGERRVRLVTVPIARATELLDVRSQEIPANGSVWVRLKTASGAADEAEISLVLARHVEVHREVPLWPAFPW